MGTWNVRTIITSLNFDLIDVNDVSKTTIINDVMLKLDTDISTLQETHLDYSFKIK